MTRLCALTLICAPMMIDGLFFGFAQRNESRNQVTVYWNVPTFMCHRYGFYFENVTNFGIRQNSKDEFRGDELAILYDPGIFPALLKDSNGQLRRRNGGVPQEGNLTEHLEVFKRHLTEQIVNESFAGVGIIDFESWRPVFRQNWASLAPYRDLSIEIERERHPFWNKKAVEKEAVRRFEKAGRMFMEETLKAAKLLRPQAQWGYYAYPYCYNLTPMQPSGQCDPRVLIENDKMSWLFNLQDVILPSVYLKLNLEPKERTVLVNGRVEEALRISQRSKHRPAVLPYFWYKYQDKRDDFLTEDDVYNTVKKILDLGAHGLIIWGSSNDLNNKTKCQQMNDYVTKILGPIIRDLITDKVDLEAPQKVSEKPHNITHLEI